MRRGLPLVVPLLLVAGVTWADVQGATKTGPPKRPAEEIAQENKDCLSCHNDPELEVDLASEEVMSMHVDPATVPGSVHAELGCTDCHTEYVGKTSGHKARTFKTLREYRVFYSEQCKDCHFTSYTETLDSVHHDVNAKGEAKGEAKAATCVDCHGAHATQKPGEPRSSISKTCGACHEKVVNVYAKSVHGAALAKEENPDVPVCTDCHKSHAITDPKTAKARLDQPEQCGTCHTDEAKMKKYGLSTKVLSTYLADFHGTTAMLQKGEKHADKPVVALCTDCHGVHDIAKVDSPDSKVMKANLAQTCRSCHKEGSDNFPDAWMYHYEPTWSKAPLVKAVDLFYSLLIPFMIGGLALQILLHLWRVLVNR